MDEKELATATYIMDMKETQFELISIISSTNVCILELKKTYIYIMEMKIVPILKKK